MRERVRGGYMGGGRERRGEGGEGGGGYIGGGGGRRKGGGGGRAFLGGIPISWIDLGSIEGVLIEHIDRVC